MKLTIFATIALVGHLAQAAPLANPHGDEKAVIEKRDDGHENDLYSVVPAGERAKMSKRAVEVAGKEKEKTAKHAAAADDYDYDFYYVVPAVERPKMEKRAVQLARKEEEAKV